MSVEQAGPAAGPAVGTRPVEGTDLGSRRWLLVAGVGYVAAWLVGLGVATSGPEPFAVDAAVHDFFAAHGAGALVQAAFVHGLAGVALGGLAVGLARALRRADGDYPRLVRGAGAAAAAVSLVQFMLMASLVGGVDAHPAATTDGFFDSINRADVVKLCLLSLFVAAVSHAGRRGRALPAWLQVLGGVLVLLLPLSGSALLVEDARLYATLYVSLPLLLVWVLAVTVVLATAHPAVRRGPRPAGSSPSPRRRR